MKQDVTPVNKPKRGRPARVAAERIKKAWLENKRISLSFSWTGEVSRYRSRERFAREWGVSLRHLRRILNPKASTPHRAEDFVHPLPIANAPIENKTWEWTKCMEGANDSLWDEEFIEANRRAEAAQDIALEQLRKGYL
ncbi:hypothetical protein WDW86_05605 [Bdellovibrionota bacterium FG-2]